MRNENNYLQYLLEQQISKTKFVIIDYNNIDNKIGIDK